MTNWTSEPMGKVIAVLVGIWIFLCALAVAMGKSMKHFSETHYKEIPLWEVPRMTGGQLGMDFLIADLHGTSETHTPIQGDVLILLTICGMGVEVTSDRRGRFLSGIPIPQNSSGPPAPLFDSFSVDMENGEIIQIKRYELRKCNAAQGTWIVSG